MDWDPMATDTDGYICPPCPVFYPTAKEFLHPLKYISSIRHIGMQAGICKIVPPKGWCPPFAINENTFRFRTRVQQLNSIEGHSRAEGQFVEALRLFLYQQGEPMKELPRVDGQLVNLHVLYKTVRSLGGFDAVCAKHLWKLVVRRVDRTKSVADPSDKLCRVYQTHYKMTLLAYEHAQETKDKSDGLTHSFETKAIKPQDRQDSIDQNDGLKHSIETKPSIKVETIDATPSGKSSSTDTRATPPSKPRSLSSSKRSSTSLNHFSQDLDTPNEHRVKRTLFSEGEHTSSEENDSLSPLPDPTAVPFPSTLEPEALKPPAPRHTRLPAPTIHVGQKFFRYFPETGAVLAQVKRVFGGKKPHVAIRYVADGSHDDLELSMMEILLANGWDAGAAELAYNSEICQVCLRGDCWDKMLLCDGCNSGQHLFCLETPLATVPTGDWYCTDCVDDAQDPFQRTQATRFGFDRGAEVSLHEFKHQADAWKRKYFHLSPEIEPEDVLSEHEIEREYWKVLSKPVHEQRIEVQYGSDVDTGVNGSGFPRIDLQLKNRRTVSKRWKMLASKTQQPNTSQRQTLSAFFAHGLRAGLSVRAGGENADATALDSLHELLERYAQDDWNLNNLPKLPGSVLQHLEEDIKGVMVPWLYAGMCFSTFCWHVEDHNFYSMSYLHCGASKTWYGIPSASAAHFERTMKTLTPELFGTQPDLHMQLVTMFSPTILREHGVPVYRATHRPNEFIVTFPSAYHAGFNTGFNCAEAVNFATLDWLPWGAQSLLKYREFHKLPVFCHEALVWTLAANCVESSAFDPDEIEAALLPAMETLVRDYRVFQARVEDQTSTMRVLKHEVMAAYDYRGSTSEDVDNSTAMRRNMTARACKRAAKTVEDKPKAKMKMQMKMETTGMRPRMVLWAGRSGKHEGLRCLVCKQYCYFQAVVCARCRPPQGSEAIVGCLDHYPTMCKCRDALNFIYLYRHPVSRLEEMVTRLRSRLADVRTWQHACDAVLEGARNVSLSEIKRLNSWGKACGGADLDRLDALETAIDKVQEWETRAQTLLTTFEHESTATVALDDVKELVKDAQTLLVVPPAVETLEQVVNEWHAAQKEANMLLKVVNDIFRAEMVTTSRRQVASSDAVAIVQSMGSVASLQKANRQLTQVCKALEDVEQQLQAKNEPNEPSSLRFQVTSAQQYLKTLEQVNNVAVQLVTQEHRGIRTLETIALNDVERVLDQVDGLHLANPRGIANTDALRKLVALAQAEALDVQEALDDRSKSTEELNVLLQRVQALPVVPSNARELKERVTSCHVWETRAHDLLVSVVAGAASYKALVDRPPLEELETFYHQADAHMVPTCSLLRRQVHARVQDCRRWYDTVHALFLRPSTGHISLAQFLTSALENAQQVAQNPRQRVRLHAQLHCICDQILSDKAHVELCRGCQRYFHPQCLAMTSTTRDTFQCLQCRPDKKKRSVATLSSVFCLCRGGEAPPMICCDFCDEWYHAACVELLASELDRIDAFRCPRCARRQHLYYLDKKLVRRDCFGRRPALARVETFVTQMQTQLIACPPGAHELVAYVDAVKRVDDEVKAFGRAFALHEFSETYTEEVSVLDLLARVTSLEIALEHAQTQLGAIHWCIRASALVLGAKNHAPKYTHLAALLHDVATYDPMLVFPREEYRLMHLTIAERVEKAAAWLRAVKRLEVEEWNVEQALRLQREARDLSAFLELPTMEVQCVDTIVANHKLEEGGEEREEREGEKEEEEEEEDVVSPSTLAWKKQRRWDSANTER